MSKFDYKKEYKDLYQPKTSPVILEVPPMLFLMTDGKGNPNTSADYKEALEMLYGISFAIKMSKMNGTQPEGYFEYVVPPLEGLWQIEGDTYDGTSPIQDKNMLTWTSMIRQPDFVTPQVFSEACDILHRKKPELPLSRLRLVTWEEGLCCQLMHIGPYDTEPASIRKMDAFLQDSGYETDFSPKRFHHEIYLGDPRRTAPERLKTVIRHPVRKK